MKPRAKRARRLAAAVITATWAASLAGAQTEPEAPTSEITPALLLADTAPDDRRASANELIAASRFAPLRAALAGDAGEDAAAAARDAIAAAPTAELLNLLAAAAASDNPARAAACVSALERAGGRDAVRALARVLTENAERAEVAAPTAAALERLTGVACDPVEPGPWFDWWSEHEWLPETEWQAALANSFRTRWRDAAGERDAYAARADTLYRRLFSELPPEGRTALLAEMLDSPRRPVRRAGLQLIESSLLNGRPVDASLAEPTARALADADPVLRALAARSLVRFAPQNSRAPALSALRTENDPGVASALLELLAAAQPDATVAELAEPWLAQPGPAADAAAQLIVRTAADGRAPNGDFSRRVHDAARALFGASPTAPVVDLLALSATDDDADQIASLIPDATPALVGACVRALCKLPGGFARLATTAEEYPALRPALADQLSRHAADLSAYRFILHMPTLDPTPRHAALTRVWNELPHTDLLTAARETNSPALRAKLLQDRLATETPGMTTDTRRGMVLLYAESVVLSGAPQDALEALGMLEPADQIAHGTELAALALQRISEASMTPPDPSGCVPLFWSGALEHLADSSPGAVAALAADQRLRAHIRTDPKAEEATLAVLRRAEIASPTPEQASVDRSDSESERPE